MAWKDWKVIETFINGFKNHKKPLKKRRLTPSRTPCIFLCHNFNCGENAKSNLGHKGHVLKEGVK